MTELAADGFAHAALAMISDLLEDHAPIAARWLPEDPVAADKVLNALLDAGLNIAALARAALASGAPADSAEGHS